MKKKIPLIGVLLLLFMQHLSAQNRIISGVVNDQKGEPIIGASVLAKGTTTGTYTDASGKFTLIINQNVTTLVVKYLGMKNKEVEIGANTSLMISMEDDVLGLDEVVVTALGVSKEKKSLGYSSQEVGGGLISQSGEENVIQGLSSKFSGLFVNGSGGTPGASSKIIIRGPSTFTGNNQPLIVIDGVPIDNSTDGTVAGDYPFNETLNGVNNSNRAVDINPDDIENVSVLKGPAATALYGARAGSGVILITTKRGGGMGKKSINFNYSTSLEFSEVNKLPQRQLQYAQGVGGGKFDSLGNVIAEGAFDEGDPGPDGLWFTDDDVSSGTPNSWGPLINSIDRTPVDNANNFFETGVTFNNNFAINGSGQNSSFRLSFGHTNDKGIVPNTEFKRSTIRLNADHKITSYLSAGASINYINSGGLRAQNGSNLSGVMLSLMRAPASYDLSAGYETDAGDNRSYFYIYDNPYWTVYNNPYTDNTNRILGNVNFNLTPTDWLDISYRVGTDVYTDSRKQVFAIYSNDPANAPGGQIEENTKRYRQVYGDLLINVKHNLTKDLGFNGTIGNNLTQVYSQDLYARGRDLTIPKFYNLSNASNLFASEANVTTRTAAWFGDFGFDWRSTVFLNITGRNEWSSTWGPNINSVFYPSVNGSFVFTELLEENKILSFGKVRLGYAQVGINPPAYSSSTYYVSPLFTDGFTDGIGFPYLGQSGFGYSQSNILGNPDLKPERQIGREIGLELKFLNGRINLDVTYYNQLSKDILVTRPIASSSGFSNVYANAGEMVNKGIEISADADIVRGKDFIWNLGGNFSRNRNEVTKIADGLNSFNVESTFGDPEPYAYVGQQYGVLFGSMWARDPDGNIIVDESGIPLAADTFGVIGSPYPQWLSNIRNTFSYKGLSLTVLFDIRKGGDIWDGTIARMNRIGTTKESGDNRDKTFIVDGVKAVDDGNGNITYVKNDIEIDAFTYYNHVVGDGAFGVRENAIFDGSWVRLRELTLAYDLPVAKVFKNTPIKSLTARVTGRNVWLKTKYPGTDPETSLNGAGSNVQGYNYFNMPGTKSWLFGLSIGF
jgi:TonB-linked SusC/RagA family outer membrane protein